MFLHKNNNKGFTLVEIIIAVFILDLLLAGLLWGFSGGLGMINASSEISTATLAITEEMETIRDMDFNDLLALPATIYFDETDVPGLSELNNPAGIVTISDPEIDTNLRKVTVSLSWTSFDGRIMNRDLTTLITRDGL